jgi:hypothetical protein
MKVANHTPTIRTSYRSDTLDACWPMKGRVKPKRLRSESTEWSGKLARLVTKDQIMVLLPFRRPGRTPLQRRTEHSRSTSRQRKRLQKRHCLTGDWCTRNYHDPPYHVIRGSLARAKTG